MKANEEKFINYFGKYLLYNNSVIKHIKKEVNHVGNFGPVKPSVIENFSFVFIMYHVLF